jgi:transcriptional regulator with XRE-family HTH domain
MTIKQGLYEFKKESLIEIRKVMEISQSKMAELLGVDEHTVSRWEAGVTVPDITSLAAIYSLARGHGIDPPFFFGTGTCLPKLKLSSNPTNQSENVLAFFGTLRNYLHTDIELIGTELAPIIKVEIRNMAPDGPDWPKIVFTGVGLGLAHTGGDDQAVLPGKIRTRTSRRPSKNDKRDREMIAQQEWEKRWETKYSRIDQREFPDVTSDEGQQGEVLFPGQSIIYEIIDVTPEVLPFLQFRTEGTVSRRHLFHCDETFVMPQNITKPLVLGEFAALNAIDLYGPLGSVIDAMPKFYSSATPENIQSFVKTLSESVTRAEAAEKELQNLLLGNNFLWFQRHLESVRYYHREVVKTLSMSQGAIPEQLDYFKTNCIIQIRELKERADEIKAETQELMGTQIISGEDVNTFIRNS